MISIPFLPGPRQVIRETQTPDPIEPQMPRLRSATGAKAPPTGRLPAGVTITRPPLRPSDRLSIAPADPPLRGGRLASGVGAAGQEPVFRAGETFPHDPAISEAEAKVAWVEQSQAVMVAVDAAGAHVANAGYVMDEQARRLGFRLMQFNLVVSTNTAGIRCWQCNGFMVVGTLPGAFRHQRLGCVDALVMVQALVEGPE